MRACVRACVRVCVCVCKICACMSAFCVSITIVSDYVGRLKLTIFGYASYKYRLTGGFYKAIVTTRYLRRRKLPRGSDVCRDERKGYRAVLQCTGCLLAQFMV